MGLLGVLFGRSKLRKPNRERFFSITTAEVSLRGRGDIRPTKHAGLVFNPVESSFFDNLESELADLLRISPNPPKDTDGRREDSGRGWVRELQGRWPGVGVDGRPAAGLQSPHRAPKALCGSCDARDGERIRSRGLSRPGWREIAGTLSQLQAGRQAGNGMAGGAPSG